LGGEVVGEQGGSRSPDMVSMGSAMVQTRRLTGGPQRFHIFLNYPNRLKHGN
jgi:hypothetical protein